MEDPKASLNTYLTQPGGLSKKYRMTVIGIIAVFAMFLLTGILHLTFPKDSASMINFAQSLAQLIAGMVAVFCGAQAVVDYRTTKSIGGQ